MDTHPENVNQAQKEKIKYDKSLLENFDYTHCFETIDSSIKIEIDNAETHLEYSPNMNTGLQNMNQQVKVEVQEFEIDRSGFENNYYTQCHGSIHDYKVSVSELANIKQEREVKIEGRVNVHSCFEKDDNIYILENTDSIFQNKGDVDGNMLVDVMNIKQEIKDHPEQISELFSINDSKDMNYNANFEDIKLTEKSDLTISTGIRYSESNNSNKDRDITSLHFKVEDNNCALKSENANLNIQNSSHRKEAVGFKTEIIESRSDPLDSGGESNQPTQDMLSSSSCPKELKLGDTSHREMSGELDKQMEINLDVHPCKICHKKFEAVHYLEKHMIRHDKIQSGQCYVCDKEYKTLAKLQQHMIIHSPDRPHECEVCDKGFKTVHTLKLHMITHGTDRPYKCSVCDKGFKTLGVLRRHIGTHSTDRPHQCNLCDKKFKSNRTLKQHMTYICVANFHLTWREMMKPTS